MKLLLVLALLARAQSELVFGRCSPDSCSKGGSCKQIDQENFECQCESQYDGSRCEHRRCDEDQDCLNGGFCEDEQCICQPDFTGPNCERNYTNPCLPSNGRPPCKKHQVCLQNRTEMRGFSCVCKPGYGGEFCGQQIASYYSGGRYTKQKEPEHTIRTMADVFITVLVQPEFFVLKVDEFLNDLSQRLRTSVKIRKTDGEMDVFEWNSIEGQGRRVGFGSRSDARAEYFSRSKRSIEETLTGVLVIFQIDLESCTKRCFDDANAVARYIAAMEAEEPLNPAMPIHVPLIQEERKDPSISKPMLLIIVVVALLALVVMVVIVVTVDKRRNEKEAPVWKVPTAAEAMARAKNDGGFYGQFDVNNTVQNSAVNWKQPSAVVVQRSPVIRSPSQLELAAIGDERITPEMYSLSLKLDPEGRNSLHLLALNSSKSASDLLSDCNLLISWGVNVNTQDLFGNTALHYACRNARSTFVKRLLEAGSDPTIENEEDMTALHESAQHFDDSCIEAILSHHVYKDKSKLQAVDLKDRTALMLYAANCTHSIRGAELLLKSGADVNCTGNRDKTYRKGRTALHHAAESNTINRRMIQFLISQGANKDAADDDGATPLWLAVSANNLMAVDELVRAGASMDFADNNDKTPVTLAQERGYATISERFRVAKLTSRTSYQPSRDTKMSMLTPSSSETTPSPPGLKASSGPSSVYSCSSDSSSVFPVQQLQHSSPSDAYNSVGFYPTRPASHTFSTNGYGLRQDQQQSQQYNPPACAFQNQ